MKPDRRCAGRAVRSVGVITNGTRPPATTICLSISIWGIGVTRFGSVGLQGYRLSRWPCLADPGSVSAALLANRLAALS